MSDEVPVSDGDGTHLHIPSESVQESGFPQPCASSILFSPPCLGITSWCSMLLFSTGTWYGHSSSLDITNM